jgi:hypothetical protein
MLFRIPVAKAGTFAKLPRRSLFAILLTIVCAQSIAFMSASSQAFAKSDLEVQVERDYNAGRYAPALESISKLQPSTWTHYYSAWCYQGLNQLQEAKREFAWVSRYSKNQSMKRNSQLGLAYVNEYEKKRTYKGQGNTFSKRVLKDSLGRVGGGFRVAY